MQDKDFPGTEDTYYDDSDYEEAVLLDEEDKKTGGSEQDVYDEYDEADDPEQDIYDGDPEEDMFPDESEDFIYDEEGHKELTPNVYYYKDEENYEEDMLYEEPEDEEKVTKKKKKMSLLKKILLGVGIFLLVAILFLLFSIFTPAGREIWYSCAGSFWTTNPNLVTPDIESEAGKLIGIGPDIPNKLIEGPDNTGAVTVLPNGPRSEDYVQTFLVFGIEEIDGASNTDTIMLISINKRDNTIKLTSILRDTYVNIPGDYPNKINSVYARGAKRADDPTLKKATGAALLVNVIENTFDVDISGYACVNFKSFEKIIDRLGGIDIELGAKEAKYLRKTNYISNPAYRTVQEGWNHMNGNQVLGYCRVRKVVTLGGANNDYGRTVRHRRVINAIIDKFKSTSFLDIVPIMEDCLAEIFTNIRDEQVTNILRDVFENSIFTTASMRLPAEEFFKDSGTGGIYNGSTYVKYTLVLGDQLGKNIEAFHKFLFLDAEGETDTTGMLGAGAGVKIESGSSSSGSSKTITPSPTPTPVTTEVIIDEEITAGTESGAGTPGGIENIPGQEIVADNPEGTQSGTQPIAQPGTQPGGEETQPGTQPGGEGTQPGTQPGGEGAQPGTQPGGEGTQPGTQPGGEGTLPGGEGTQPGTQPGGEGAQPGTQPGGEGAQPIVQPGTQPGGEGAQSGTLPGGEGAQPGTQPGGEGAQPGTQPGGEGAQPGTQPGGEGTLPGGEETESGTQGGDQSLQPTQGQNFDKTAETLTEDEEIIPVG
ncbi:MAG: LCP family protein [Lachnospiraceae bacterium]|nr:LCP family protein [Lachnospiraceae bacterium]